MIWFDKKNQDVMFTDIREEHDHKIWSSTKNDSVSYINVDPDIIADFTDLPFEDNTFFLVVFDPPHLIHINETAWMYKKYGKLHEGWEPMIRDGYRECMRVLKPYGTLIFKWSERDISAKKIIEVIGDKPLFGNRSGKSSSTIWMTFMKGI